MSEEGEIPPKEEDNLNKSSGEDEEMYLWDELKYKANYVCFISNESTEQQVRIASAAVDKLEEPVYDHRTRCHDSFILANNHLVLPSPYSPLLGASLLGPIR